MQQSHTTASEARVCEGVCVSVIDYCVGMAAIPLSVSN